MKKILTLLLFVTMLFSYKAYSQSTFLGADKLGFFYYYQNNEIIKLDSTREKHSSFSDIFLDKNIQIDLLNPLQPVILSTNSRSIIWLDKYLSKIAELSFDNINVDNPVSFCISIETGFWIIGDDYFSLYRVNKDGSVKFSTTLPDYFQNKCDEKTPIIIKEHNNRVYIYNKNSGLLTYDIFGYFLFFWPTINGDSIAFTNSTIAIIQPQQIEIYNIITQEKTTVNRPKQAKDIFAFKEKLAYFDLMYKIHFLD
ncbi:MAG: hypothetical protein JXA53_01330 [Bacteroidales bacterium]|nr:hypothetical protein [Bacteroidales bacterium]